MGQTQHSFLETVSARPQPFADWLSGTNEITRVFLAAGSIPGLINIAGGLPDPSTFLTDEIAEITARAVRDYPAETIGYGPIEGLRELRALIAERFSSPALALDAENVLITTSGMQGLDLIGKALLNFGDTVTCQFPTYLGAVDAWRPRSPRYRNMDLTVPDLNLVTAMTGSKFAYVVPNFSNPTGRLVGHATRQALVDASIETGTWLIEDDPYATLNYGDPLPPTVLELTAATRAAPNYEGQTVYLGTMSKQISPGLRIGWAVASREMIQALTLAKQGSDMCTSGITQHIALAALRSGLIERLKPRMVALYRKRRDALCEAMSEHLTEWFDWEVPDGGMFVWARAKDPALDTDRLLHFAMAEKVCVSPSSVFDATGADHRALRLNFTLNDEDKLAEAIRRLARATQALLAEG